MTRRIFYRFAALVALATVLVLAHIATVAAAHRLSLGMPQPRQWSA